MRPFFRSISTWIDKGRDKEGARRLALLVVAIAILVSLLMIGASAFLNRNFTTLELMLFQVLVLGLGLAGSFAFGRVSAPPPANARSAFRRGWSLYQALGRFQATIDERGELLRACAVEAGGQVHIDLVDALLAHLRAQIGEQVSTANDAVLDWQDLAPDEVEILRAELKATTEVERAD
jgi:hypothetical protein